MIYWKTAYIVVNTEKNCNRASLRTVYSETVHFKDPLYLCLPELLNTSFYCSQAFKIVLEAEIQTISWYNWYLKKYRSSPIFLHISIGHKDFGKDWQFAIYDNSGSPNTVRLKVAKCIHRADKYIIVYWLGEPFFMV